MTFFLIHWQTTTESWERSVFAQTFGNLGTEEVYDEIQDLVKGKYDSNPKVRIAGIYALSSYRQPKHMKNKVSFHKVSSHLFIIGSPFTVHHKYIGLIHQS